jgi:hypothetical protein
MTAHAFLSPPAELAFVGKSERTISVSGRQR